MLRACLTHLGARACGPVIPNENKGTRYVQRWAVLRRRSARERNERTGSLFSCLLLHLETNDGIACFSCTVRRKYFFIFFMMVGKNRLFFRGIHFISYANVIIPKSSILPLLYTVGFTSLPERLSIQFAIFFSTSRQLSSFKRQSLSECNHPTPTSVATLSGCRRLAFSPFVWLREMALRPRLGLASGRLEKMVKDRLSSPSSVGASKDSQWDKTRSF